MKTIQVYVGTGMEGSRITDTFEVEDDATEEQIEEDAKEVMFNMISWGWRVGVDKWEPGR